MKYSEHFDITATQAVGDNVWRVGNDEFACSRNTSRPPDFGMGRQQVRLIENAQDNTVGGGGVVAGDGVADSFEIAQRRRGPADFHRDAANFLRTRATSSSVAKSP